MAPEDIQVYCDEDRKFWSVSDFFSSMHNDSKLLTKSEFSSLFFLD